MSLDNDILGVFLQFFGQQRDLLSILHPLGTFLQFSALHEHFCTFPHKQGYFWLQFSALHGLLCNFPQIGGFCAIFWTTRPFLQFSLDRGISVIFWAAKGNYAIFYLLGTFLQFVQSLGDGEVPLFNTWG
ncbi:hypothetical protein Taro_016729, partial [Colocasia esculenta]|nr:hypothetical protein [Colocasia esculenta]